MEFSYQISEDDYVRGSKLAAKTLRTGVVKTILFWAFVVITLVCIFGVITQTRQVPQDSDDDPAQVTQPVSSNPSTQSLIQNLVPLAAVIAVWAGLILFWLPHTVRKRYRKDTNSHGVITLTLDPDQFALRSSTRISYQSGWNAFTEWREKGDLALLRYPNGTFQFIVLSGLSLAEREQLRGILTAVLPRKN